MEDRLQALEARVRLLEQLVDVGAPARTAAPAEPAAPPVKARPAPWPPPPPPRAPRPPAARRQPLDLEELLGGRLLGWVGGLAVFLAAVFFLVMAVRNGWIDEPTRVALAFAGSTALLGTGLWLYERKGQTEAALAAVAAAIAALYASDTTATAVYGLVSSTVGLVLAVLIGVAATAVAVRWSSVIVAAIGIVGALLAPVLVDAGTSSASLAFMALALCSAVGVVIWRRWSWLSVTAYVVSLPQLLAWANDERDGHVGLTLVVLGAFWALYVVAALGYELREPTTKLRASSALLLFPNAAVTAATGWFVLHDSGNGTGATAWVLVVAVAHAALGLVSLRGRISTEIGGLLAAVGGTLAAVGMALALDGPALVAGWTAEAVLVAWVARRTGDWRGYIGSVAFLAAAAVHALVFEARPDGLAYGLHSVPTTVAGLVLVGAGCAGVAQLLPAKNEDEANALRGACALVALYLASLLVVDVGGAHPHDATQTSQLALSAFWAVLGLGSLIAGLGRDRRPLRLAGLSLLALAVGKVFVVDLAALESIWRVASFLALGLLLLAGAFAYQRMRQEGPT